MNDEDEEGPLEQPYWRLESLTEIQVIDGVLRRIFRHSYEVLTDALEFGDPLEVVYPGQFDEYNDVLRELMVLLADRYVDLNAYSEAEIRAAVRTALARGFGEPPVEENFEKTIARILARR